MAPARPVNNEGQQDQSAADNPNGSGADAGLTPSSGSPRQTSQRPAVPPDDRLTTILPPVRDEAPNRFRDPIEAVKAALDGRPSSRSADSRDSLDMASAALDSKTSRRQEKPAGGSGGPPTGGPPGGRPPGPAAAEASAAGLGSATRLGLAAPHQLDVGPSRALRQRRGDPAAADRHVRDGLLHRRHSQARRHPHQPGVDDSGQRRLRAGENRSPRR